MKDVQEKANEILGAVFHMPHPKIRKGKITLMDEDECRKYGTDSTIKISPYAHIDLTGDVEIGAWSLIEAYVQIHTHEHDVDRTDAPLLRLNQNRQEEMVKVKGLHIGSNVWIHHSWILAGCTWIADGVVIGAGSVVTRPVLQENTIWAGNPARMIRKRGIHETENKEGD